MNLRDVLGSGTCRVVLVPLFARWLRKFLSLASEGEGRQGLQVLQCLEFQGSGFRVGVKIPCSQKSGAQLKSGLAKRLEGLGHADPKKLCIEGLRV